MTVASPWASTAIIALRVDINSSDVNRVKAKIFMFFPNFFISLRLSKLACLNIPVTNYINLAIVAVW
jgi:hypothetical protein